MYWKEGLMDLARMEINSSGDVAADIARRASVSVYRAVGWQGKETSISCFTHAFVLHVQ